MMPGMGTVITHKVYGDTTAEALRAAEAETARLERLLSRFMPESDIGRLNSMAGRGPVKVRHETFEVLSRALDYSSLTGGAFDVTTGPLVTLWKVLKRTSAPPAESEISITRPLVDYTDLLLNDRIKSAELKKEGQSVDLGGIGKRYHHILDPRTGYPADSGLVSATVVADSSMEADALSTAVFVLGPEKGIELLSAFPGAEAVLVGADMRAYVTSGLAGAFQPAEGTEAVVID
jgi:thiamine biosynthesis lipoprotein ApbE